MSNFYFSQQKSNKIKQEGLMQKKQENRKKAKKKTGSV